MLILRLVLWIYSVGMMAVSACVVCGQDIPSKPIRIVASGAGGHGIIAPDKTPAAIIRRLNQEIVRYLNQPDVKRKFFDAGVETVARSPEEYAAKIKAEMARMGKVIKDAGIREE